MLYVNCNNYKPNAVTQIIPSLNILKLINGNVWKNI